jgi:type IV pilus assembly protein PilV
MRKNIARRAPRWRHHQGGVGLIEVLVSVLVVTVGLLGAAALQATAMRNNQGSYERTQNSILTQGIFDAMRANMAGVAANGYSTGGWVCTAPASADLASSDIARWITSLHTQIHAGACGSIDCAAGVCTVGVRWDDSRATGGSATQAIEMRAQL